MPKSKKILPVNFTALMVIFSKLRHGRSHSAKEIQGYTGFKKQRLNYWLDKLYDEGILDKHGRGLYYMTDQGKRM
jgi:predicted transcriptional regulator